MDPRQDKATPRRPAVEQALPTILRGEELLEEAREVARKISGRVHRAVTERTTPDDSREVQLPAGLS